MPPSDRSSLQRGEWRGAPVRSQGDL